MQPGGTPVLGGTPAKLGGAPAAGAGGPGAATQDLSTPKAKGIGACLLAQATEFQPKRGSESQPSGPADKKRKVVTALATLLLGGDPEPDAGTAQSSSLSFGENEDESSSLFGGGPSAVSAEPLSMWAERRPGRLFEMGLQKVREDLAALQGSRPDSDQMRRVMSFYYAVIFVPHHPSASEHTRQEMRTLSEIMDCLCEGNLPRLGDVAMQRFKALACATDDGNWAVAQELELLSARPHSIVSEAERQLGARRQMSAARLATSLQALRSRAAAPLGNSGQLSDG